MAEKKSILTEALLDIKNIQSALNANTKEILRSVAKEEINSVVRESLLEKEDDFDEEDMEPTDDMGATAPIELGGEESDDDDELGGLEVSDEVGSEMEPELGMDSDELGGDELDMTAASDDDVLAIYKKLSGEDEIEIVGDEIHLTVTEPGEYIIKTGALGGQVGGEEEMDIDSMEPMGDEELGGEELGGEEELGDEDGTDYEIEMGDEDEEGEDHETGETPDFEAGEDEESDEELPIGDEDEDEEPLEEVRHGGNMKYNAKTGGHQSSRFEQESVNESIKAKKLVSETAKKYNSLLTEAKKLKNENDEFRGALKEFRTKLVETVVFNSNLTYVTRLFMEHATTKAEKQNIIKRFDEEVSNLKESKKLYKSIVNELGVRKPINETLENKFTKGVTTSTSKQLNESTAYVDPSTKRIIELMNIKNK